MELTPQSIKKAAFIANFRLAQLKQQLDTARMMKDLDPQTWSPVILKLEIEVKRWEAQVFVANFSESISLELCQKALNAHEIAKRRRTNCIFTRVSKDEKNQMTIFKKKMLVKSELTKIDEE
jgi:hypothetical protein